MRSSIRIGIVTPAFFYVPYWAGLEQGRYAAQELDVGIDVLGGIDAVTRELKAGTIDIGIGSPEHVIHDVESGGNLRMVGGNVNRLTHSLIVQPSIHSLLDLRGKRIGVSALTAGTSSLFMGVLEDRGLHYPGDYAVVEVGAVPPRHAMLLSGEIDAAMQTDPHNYIAEDAGLRNLGPLSQWIPAFQFTSVNVRRGWAQQHRPELTRLLRVAIEASRWMVSDRAGAVAVAAKYMDVPRKYLDRAWDDHGSGAVSLDLHLSRAGIDAELALIRRDRSGTHRVADGSTPETYVEAAYLREAQRLAGVPDNILA